MDYLEELKKWNCKLEPASGGRVLMQCPCPQHEDKDPSCQVFIEESDRHDAGDFWCPVCKKSGKFYDLLALITKTPAAVFKKQYNRKVKKIDARKVTKFHGCLASAGHKTAQSETIKRELYKRGVTDQTLKDYLIGYDTENKCLMFPIVWGSQYVNILRYRPGATKNKFSQYSVGFGKFPVLYPENQLTFDKIILCGGPVKALVAAQEMNKHGYGAVSFLGEYCIPAELIPFLYGKKVYTCFDIDKTGVRESDKTCGVLRSKVEWVGNVKLPLSIEVYPKGDINDYFGQDEDYTSEDFLKVLEETPEWEDKTFANTFEATPEEVDISKLWGYKKAFNFRTKTYISGIDDSTAYKVPKSVSVSCTGDSEKCSICRLMRSDGYDPTDGVERDIVTKDPACLSFINVSKTKRNVAFKEYFGIPEDCYKCQFEASEELYTIRYVLLSDTESDSEVPITATVITQGEELACGEICEIEGRVDQSPLTFEEVRLITKHKPIDILSEYKVKDPELLKIFQPEDSSYEALCRKIDDINFDLERNVTFIYERPDVHTLFDLTFHSPLWIPFENASEPGWISCLLVSETAQGKSTIMRRLIEHYGYGSYIDAANTSIAGLVGGIKSIGKRQFVKWGILPQMDKRLVCIEEYANAPVELLRAMRATRDSGYVVLNKIDKGRAKARTRTIVMSNPKKLMKPGAIVDGVSLLEDLVERPEDLRRFDVGMWIPKIEMDQWHESDEPKYTKEACHELLTWAWTLPIEHIEFTEEAIEAIRSNTMKEEYPNLYLVGAREFDVKLARLSAAIAARTYSVDDNGILKIEVRHITWVINFLKKLYDDPEFGFKDRVRRETELDTNASDDQIYAAIKQANSPVTFVDFLISFNRYTESDLRAAINDSFNYDQIRNKLLILGCIVGEEDTRWNNVYLPTKRLKRHLADIRQLLLKQYSTPAYMKGLKSGTSTSEI